MNRVFALIILVSAQVFSSTGTAKTALKLRSQPSTSSEAVGSVPDGASFEVLDQQGDFYHVNSKGQEGFLAAKYVSIKIPPTPQEQAAAYALIAYLFFGLIVGEVMIRGYMMRFFNSLTFFSTEGPINFFVNLIIKRLGWELFVAVLSVAFGSTIGPFYLIYRFIKSRQEQNFEVAQ